MNTGTVIDRLCAENAELRAALQKIADSSVGIDEKNGCQRAWMECARIARAALSPAHGDSK